jgi:diacylglycerol kinase family enzyme
MQVYRDTRPFSALIDCDDQRFGVRALQITIGNGRQYGGGMLVSDDAAVDDGQLDVLCIHPRPLSDLLLNALALKRGRARESRVARTARGRHVRVTTRRRHDVTADGEIVTTTPIDVTIEPGALGVFASAPPELSGP